MERINCILQHQLFQQCIEKNKEAEADRRFCHHHMGHFLDVARIAMIINLQEGLGLSRELIYASALLHDIGRHVQYADGTPHEQASAKLAPEILEACGFTASEQETIIEAILLHRTKEIAQEPSLNGVLYRADKLSRACFACEAEGECDWKADKKNRRIIL